MTSSTDLAGQLAAARVIVQTFDAALAGLSDSDLTETVRSPSYTPKVTGSPNPAAPFLGDTGLRHQVMVATVDCHHAAVALCAIEFIDDPLPWEEPPVPDRRALPAITTIRRHLAHLDTSLAEVQTTHMPVDDDQDQAAVACRLILESDALTYQPNHDLEQPAPPRRIKSIWTALAASSEPTCHLCGELDRQRINVGTDTDPEWTTVPRPVVGRICARCRANAAKATETCRNPLDRDACRRVIAFPNLGLCSSCYQAERDAKRDRSPILKARLTEHATTGVTMRTSRCTDCGRGCTVPDGTTPRCDTCRNTEAA